MILLYRKNKKVNFKMYLKIVMEELSNSIEQRIKNNAVISYLYIIINISFLIWKNNKLINNNFVKSHTKSAILIHLLFLINTIVFSIYWLPLYYEIMWYTINDIIAISIYLVLFWILLFWMYKAYSGKEFILSDLNWKDNISLEVDSETNFSEKDKLSIILSRIPFVWFYISWQFKKNKLIKNNIKLNLLVTSIISVLYIYESIQLASLLLLVYIIFITFTAINIFIRNKTISINLDNILLPNEILNNIIIWYKYLLNYFKKENDFVNFNLIKDKFLKEKEIKDNKLETILNTKSSFKLNNNIIYIPFVNLITIFNLDVKEKIHILNWLIITLIISILILSFWINNSYQIILLFPIAFWLWYLNAWILNYKIPIIYNIFSLINNIFLFFITVFNKVKKIKNTQTEVNLKVK